MKTIVLASKSPRRKKLFKRLGIKFKIESSDYQEKMNLKLSPRGLARHLSRQKAKAVAKKYKNAIIIAADTFVVFKGKIFGKPHTEVGSKKMLKKLNGKAHSVITGFTIINTKNRKITSKSVETKVYFKKLTQKEIDDYVKTKEPLDKAGAYAIQGLGKPFIKKIDGDHLNVVGLPLKALAKSLRGFNIKIPSNRF